MTTIKNMNYDEQKEFAELLNNWLKMYTGDVLKHVAPRFDEIAQSEFAMSLLRELKAREDKETKEEISTIKSLLYEIQNEKEMSDVYFRGYHSHCLTHSGSYRDILWDLYIKDKIDKEVEKNK